uniref:Uncharacterized protein n=1 Tax=Glossina austeni TaxID=7395 RepID=A0A1A9UMF6_GLOAU
MNIEIINNNAMADESMCMCVIVTHYGTSPFATSDESVRHLNNSQEWINKITNSGSSTCDDIFKECSKSVLSIFMEIVDYLYNIKYLNKTFYSFLKIYFEKI